MVSILMPMKNASRYVGEAIESIVAQTYGNWELIIVDDHSTDNSVETVRSFANVDRRIHLFPNKGEGILPALQTASGRVSGTTITRMDADDLMPKDKLAVLRSTLNQADAKTLVTGKSRYFGEKEISLGYQKYEEWLNGVVDRQSFFTEIYRECTIASPNWMTRTADFQAMGGYERIQYPEDYDMVFRLRNAGFTVKGIDQVTHLWREHPNRTSRHSAVYQQASFFRLKMDYFLKSEIKPDQHLVVWGAGKKGKLVAKRLIEANLPFTWMDWRHERYQAGIYSQPIVPIENFEAIEQPIVISTVWPPDSQKRDIERFVKENHLRMGVNFFEF